MHRFFMYDRRTACVCIHSEYTFLLLLLVGARRARESAVPVGDPAECIINV